MKCVIKQQVLLCLCLLFSAPSWAGIITDWLLNQEGADGSYGQTADIATNYQTSAEALRTLYSTNSIPPSGLSNSLNFINSELSNDTEYLSRKIITKSLFQEDVNPLIGELISRQNTIDGGFSDFNGNQSSVYTTSYGLEALAISGNSLNHSVTGAISYLANQQLINGSWSESSVYETALSLLALSHYRASYNLNAVLTASQNFIISRNNWGQSNVKYARLVNINTLS